MRLGLVLFLAIVSVVSTASAQCIVGAADQCSGRGVCVADADGVGVCACSSGWTGEANDFDCVSHTLTLRVYYAVVAVVIAGLGVSPLLRIVQLVRYFRQRHARPQPQQLQGQHQQHHPHQPAAVAVAGNPSGHGGHSGSLFAYAPFQNLLITYSSLVLFFVFALARVAGSQRIGRDVLITWAFGLGYSAFYISRVRFVHSILKLHLSLVRLEGEEAAQSGRWINALGAGMLVAFASLVPTATSMLVLPFVRDATAQHALLMVFYAGGVLFAASLPPTAVLFCIRLYRLLEKSLPGVSDAVARAQRLATISFFRVIARMAAGISTAVLCVVGCMLVWPLALAHHQYVAPVVMLLLSVSVLVITVYTPLPSDAAHIAAAAAATAAAGTTNSSPPGSHRVAPIAAAAASGSSGGVQQKQSPRRVAAAGGGGGGGGAAFIVVQPAPAAPAVAAAAVVSPATSVTVDA